MSLQFFLADDGSDGTELWVTNGTSPGTFLLKDINPGLAGASVGNLVQSNGIMYFTASDGTATHLWRSDGTSAGTFALSSSDNGDNASSLINVNGTLYYLGSDSVHGSGLFKTDGTVGGTSFVQTVSNPSAFMAVGNTLFFQSYDPTNGYELWKSDGTAGGTGIVKDIMPGGGSASLANFTTSGGKLYFTADDGTHGQELWVSNGTSAGTFQIKDINLGASASNPANLYSAGGKLIFTANDGAHGTQLYATDGTSAGTHVLSVTGYNTGTFTTFHNIFYFIANDPSGGSAIFTSDGVGVTKLSHLGSVSSTFYNIGAKLMFLGDDGTHGSGLYTFDGTTTSFVSAVPGGFSQPVVSNGKLFFVSSDATHGNELWVTDGTAAGTHITADLNPGTYDAGIGNLSAVGTGVVFSATRPDVGTELFFSDGTAAGTGLVSDVNPTGNHSPYLSFGSDIFSAGGKGFFAADDNVHGQELWVADGTTAGTHMVTDLVIGASASNPQNFYSFGGKIYFTADDNVNGRQLYVSDGSAGGTIRLSSANLSQPINDANDFFTLGGHFYYYGYNPAGGYGIYTSDGTVAGTTKVVDLNYVATVPLAFGTGVVFYGNDAVNPNGLYSFNGTALTFIGAVSDYENPVVSGGNLFFRSNDGGNGSELWVYNGTSLHLTADLNPGPYDSTPQNIASLGNGSVVFTAYNPTTGTELYVSDGTAAGTKLVSDVNPTGDHGPYLSINSDIYAAGTKGFFAADDNIHGNELWVGDGTVAGSHLVTDMVVGASGAAPQNFFSSGGKIYFTADDGVHGRQLYTSDGTAAGTVRLTTTAVGGEPYNNSAYFFTQGGHFFYLGYDPTSFSSYSFYTSDGTVAGTTKVVATGFSGNAIAFGSGVAFYGDNGTNGAGLYTFDGTSLHFVATVGDYEIPVVSAGNLFFHSSDGGNGSELWVYDGTSTHLVKDINPGSYDSNPIGITSLGNGSVVFTAYNPASGYEIYVSNGTSAGTSLLSDINTTGDHGPYLNFNTDIFAAGTKGFFAADDNIHGNELWVGDGTVAGSHMVTDMVVGANGSNPQNFFSSGGKIYFTADDGVHGRQLYTSDGTAAGTVRLTTTGVGGEPYNNSAYFFTQGGHFFYLASDPTSFSGYSFYTSNGTVAGTTKVVATGFSGNAIAFGSGVAFYGDNGTNGAGLYTFNGASLHFVANVSDYEEPVVSAGNLFFRSSDGGNGSELWVYNGTSTQMVADINVGGSASPGRITSLGGGKVVFVADDGVHGPELYVSDGTAGGTTMLGDLFPDAQGSDPQSLTQIGSKVFFTANFFSTVDGAHGRELFVTDGTAAGTTMLKDILPGSGDGNPNQLFVSGGKLFFSANDGINGYQLWTSDGTSAGTQKLLAGDGNDDNNPGNFIVSGTSHFFFTGNAGLFYSDGTTAGTHLIGSSSGFDPNVAEVVNGVLLFRAYDNVNGYELWKSDGTAAGTVRVTDTLLPNGSNPGNYTFVGGKVFFTANDGVHGLELYVTNGTSAGTTMIKDIDPGSADSNPNQLFALNGKLYFSAHDDVNGYQLWKSDGTSAGTQAITTSDSSDDGNPGNFVTVDATHFFFTGNSGLFYSDGTTAGTHLVGSSSGFDLNHANAVGGVLLYQSYDSVNGYELWRSDGSVAGTVRVTDTLLPNSSGATGFTFLNGKVYFLANDGTHGQELFVTNGTTGGTSLVKDINPGLGDSNVNGLFVLNGHLYFSAHDDVNGYQLWTSDGTASGTQVVGTSDASDDGNPGNFITAGGTHFFFTANAGLFYSDGTTAGTHLVGSSSGFDINHANVVGGVLFYQSYDNVNGYEMWKSDGTAAGTSRVTDTEIPNSSSPGSFAAIDNVPPTVTGTTTVSINDNVTTHPFATTVIGDADTPVQTMAVTITLDDTSKGAFTAASLTASGFVGGGVAGSYTFSGTPAQATAAIQALVFQPTNNHLVVGNSETATFTVTVNDGAGGSVVNHLTTVTATSINDAPTPVADAVAVNEDATASTSSRATGLLGNDTDADVGETATIKVSGAHFGAASDTAVASTGTTNIVGTYGTLHLAADGTYSYTPNSAAAEALPKNQAASDVFSYTVADLHGATTVSTLTFNITGQEDAPVAVANTVAVNEDVAATAATRATGLLGNDTDVDSGEQATLKVTGAHFGAASDTVVAASGTTNIIGTYGTLILAADGTYSYTPNTTTAEALTVGQAASDAFSYTITDAQGVTSTSTVTFNITGVNDVPVAVANAASVNEDATAAAATRATGLLGNDSDADTGETATLKVTGAHVGAASDTTVAASGTTDFVGTYGTLHLAADGTYSYTPNNAAAEALTQGQVASDVFSYTVADVHGASSTSTLTFNITGQEDAPVAVANTVAVNEDVTASAATRATGLLGNDTDVDNGEQATLKVSGAHVGAASDTAVAASGTTDIAGTYGTLHLAADGTYSYTPGNASAEALTQGQAASDVFSYTIVDAQGVSSTSTLTFNITGQNDGPVAVAETVALNEDASAAAATRAAGLLGNDSDVDSGETATLKVTGAHVGATSDTAVAASGTTDIIGTYGTLHLTADGTYSYTANSGTAEALTQGQAASDVFSYTVADVHGASTTSTLTFNLTGQEDAPVAVANATAVNEDATASAITRAAGLLGNDTDIDSGEQATLKVSGAHVGAASDTAVAASGTTDITGTYGTLHLAADGTYSYTPGNATAEALTQGQAASDVFSYTIVDAQGVSSTSTLTFNITGQNDGPVAVANSASINEDATATAATRATGLLGNDSDADTGETATLKVTGAHIGAASDTAVAASGTTDIVGTYGTLHLAADGTYSYTANSGTAEALTQGQAASDVFSYTVADVHGASTTSTLTFNITGQNDAPVAVANATAVNEDATASAITRGAGLLGNDTDVDSGEQATLKVSGAHVGAASDTAVAASGMTDITGTYGTLHLAADGTYSYTPGNASAEALTQGQAASDVFSYTIVDAQGASSTSTLTFNITGQNDGPVAVAESASVNEDATAAAATRATGLLGNDSDIDSGETATLKVTGAHIGSNADTAVAASGTTDIVGTYGTLHLASDGTYTYTPNNSAAEALTLGQTTTDLFTYTVSDVHGATTTSTLTFNITGQNDTPVAVADTVAVNEDATAAAASRATGLLGNDSDVDSGETATLKVSGAHAGAASDTAVAASGTTDIVGTYGTLHLAADGTYSYTPGNAAAEALTQGQAASDVFSYTVIDVHGASTTSTLTFNVTGQNDGPVAAADVVAINEDVTAAAATRATGLLGNDSDADTGETATLKVTGAHIGAASDTNVATSGTTDIVGTYGTLHLMADGSYSYTPNNGTAEALTQGQAASDVFSYTVTDVHGATTTSTLTFNVTGQNDAPALVADLVAVNEDATAAAGTRAAGLLGNDSDADSGETATLKVSGAHAGSASDTVVAASGTTDIVGTYGTLHLAADGTYSYTPGNTAAEALTLGQTASDVFSYTVIDVHGATMTSTLTFNVTGQNDGPVAVAETVALNEDVTAAAATRATGLLGNDSDADSGETATLKVSGAHVGAASDTAIAASGTTDIVGTYGTLHLAADGSYSYTPNSATAEALPQGQAASDVFSYTVADVHGASTTSTLTFNITGQNDAPALVADVVAVSEDATVAAGSRATGLLGNDSDADSGQTATLLITGAHAGAASDMAVAASGTTDIIGTYGTLHLMADGTYSYTPDSAAAEALPQGQAASDVFSYTVTDTHGTSTTSTVTFNVTGVDDAAVAVDDSNATLETTAIVAASVFGNDHDVDNPLLVGAVNGSSAAVGTQITLASGALLTLRADGTYDYDPNHAFDALTGVAGATNHIAMDSFTYTLSDGNTATVEITVTGVSTPGDQAMGTGGNDSMTGTGNSDYFNLSTGGDDTASGGGGNDAFYMGAAFAATDHIDGGAGTNDQIGLQGDYTGGNALVLGADTIAGIEAIGLLTGFSYDITTNDGNVAAGQMLSVFGSTLGAGESFTFNGSAETDGSFRIYGGLGADTITTGAGDDGIYFGRDGRFDPTTDHVDGGAGNDQMALDGSYTLTISNANVTNVELLSLLDDVPATHNQYHITLADDWTAAGQTHTVYGVTVRDGFTLDASAESDGNLKVYGGQGTDTITTGAGSDWIHGGAGADILNGGGGGDTFAYSAISNSIGSSHDIIINFDAAHDHIDLPTAVTGIDAAITTGTLNAGSLDSDLTAALAGLNANHAVSFTADHGDLAGHIFEVIDTNGVAGYQAGQDMVIELQNPVTPITTPAPFI